MKKSIVAILIIGTLAASAVLAACGQPTATAPRAVASSPDLDATPADYRPQEERQLDEARRQILVAMMVSASASPVDRAGMNTALDQIEDAQRTLGGIADGRAMLMAIMVNQGASSGEIDTALGAIEDARQEVLARLALSR